MITPFRDDALDERALRELVEDQIAKGIDGLVPCGTTGESAGLSHAEYVKAVTITVQQAKGRVPVMAGAGSASTRHAIELAQLAQKAGADGLLVVAPYYVRPSQDGLLAHFRAVAAAVDLPLVVYNIPIRCGVDVSLTTIERLADVPTIVAVKEASGNVIRSADIVAKLGDRFTILSGDDGLTVPILAVGGQGVISVASNLLPGEVARVVHLFRDGDVAGARVLAQRLRPLYDALFAEPNPGPIKAALAMCGRIAPEARLPLLMPSQATEAQLRAVMQPWGILP